MAATSFQNKLDAVILGRGCDPWWFDPLTESNVYELSQDKDGVVGILSWSPPTDDYGECPTQSELDSTSMDQRNEAEEQLQKHSAEQMLGLVNEAIIAAISEAANLDASAVRADVLDRLVKKA